jgi:hypothetical protein
MGLSVLTLTSGADFSVPDVNESASACVFSRCVLMVSGTRSCTESANGWRLYRKMSDLMQQNKKAKLRVTGFGERARAQLAEHRRPS